MDYSLSDITKISVAGDAGIALYQDQDNVGGIVFRRFFLLGNSPHQESLKYKMCNDDELTIGVHHSQPFLDPG